MSNMSKISPPRFHLSRSSLTSTPLQDGTHSPASSTAEPDGHLRVVARIRPMNHIEAKRGCRRAIYAQASESSPTARKENQPDSILSRLRTSFQSPTVSDEPEQLDAGIVLTDATSLANVNDYRSPPPKPKSLPTRLIAEAQTRREFEFDAVFDTSSTQRDVYDGSLGQAVRHNLFRGYNTTVLAYGQTSSGKTYTMSGPRDARALAGELVSPPPSCTQNTLESDDGMIGRAIHDLFCARAEYEASGHQIGMELSCLEIYQEELRDLLVDGESSLQLRDHGDVEGVSVRGLKTIAVDSIQQVKDLMDWATRRRTTASTRLNERSSRSHSVCTLQVTVRPPSTAKRARPIKAKLTLVDLAGSERIKDTGVVGVQKQESININKDLFVLGKVVAALSERAKSKSSVGHIPYRDSKLTRLLRDSLGGNCCTVLIACVSPADINVDESINTLRYAERSKTITNTVKQNVVQSEPMSRAECASMRAENKRLQAQVVEMKRRLLALEDCQGSEANSPPKTAESVSEGLAELQNKLKRAKEEARVAKENSRMVVESADRWREHFENARNRSLNGSVVSPCLSYELSVAGVDDEASLIDDDEMSCLSLDTTSKKLLSEDTTIDQLKVELEALANEKALMKDSLEEISEQIESKTAELEGLDDEVEAKRNALAAEIERQEKYRDELAKEVTDMKLRIHLLASDLKSDDVTSQQSFRALLRGFGADRAADAPKDEVEMRTMRILNGVGDNKSMKLAQELGKNLGEERARCKELEEKCQSLQQQLNQVETERVALCERNRQLESNLKHVIGSADGKLADDLLQADATDNGKIRANAKQILQVAAKEIAEQQASTCSSTTFGTSFFPGKAKSPDSGGSGERFVISNIDEVGRGEQCVCESSLFTGDAEHVEFYLPQLSVTCTCGKHAMEMEPNDPAALASILRPWQVEFLKSIGIDNTVEFVHAFHQRGSAMAKQLRVWRKERSMLSVKNKSCQVALHIWARTCKSVVRAVREQEARGVTHPQRPDFLEVSVAGDNYSVSTIGLSSVVEESGMIDTYE